MDVGAGSQQAASPSQEEAWGVHAEHNTVLCTSTLLQRGISPASTGSYKHMLLIMLHIVKTQYEA